MATNVEESFKTRTTKPSSSAQPEYDALKSKGKALARSGRLEESLPYLMKAYKMCRSDKLKEHIRNIRGMIEENEQADIDMIEICQNFRMSKDMYENLYPYQRDAIKWMWGLYEKKKGGVLGDDMGLGKTIQIIAFLSALMDENHIKTALLIMPVSLIENWKKEFGKWAPEIVVKEYHATAKKDRERSLRKIQISGGVLITTYGIVGKNVELLRTKDERHFVWDYVVLDEGHKIKNPTKTTKAVHDIYAKHRLVLTGTPVQNNLKELWALYDFVQQGTLLGSLQTFRMQYETAINKSREKDATAAEKILGSRIAENLRTRIEPYFLRRTKQEVLESNGEANGSECSSAFSRLKRDMSMIRKNEFIMWVFLSPIQIKIYTDFLESDKVKNVLVSKRSPLVELTVLKKISDHPRLLSHRACVQLGLEGSMSEDEMAATLEDDVTAYFDIKHTPDNVLIEESGKMGILFQLLENLRSEGHRTLVFSQSCRILDIIQKVLCNRDWKVLRLDGKIRKTTDREKVVYTFQNNSSYPVFLLTTQVGGVGLTLTAADRVVIYDPSWNPATDSQAVDRAYRIGQTKSVVIYRLISCGSVEEKIYRRQIFKDSITQQTTGKSQDPHRYFTSQELRELFILDDPKVSTTQLQLEGLHGGQRKTDTFLDSHVAFLYSLDIFGISDHDLMFKGITEDQSGQEEVSDAYIKEKVTRAEMLMALESDLTKDTLIKTGAYAKPFDVPIKSYKSSGTQQVIDRHPPEYDLPVIDLTAEGDTSVEAIAHQLSFLDVTSEKIKSEFSTASTNLATFCAIESSEDEVSADEKLPLSKKHVPSEKIKSEHSKASTSTRLEAFCEIESSEDELSADESKKIIVKQPIVISDADDFHKDVSQTGSSHINSVNESKQNSLLPDDLSETMEIFPSDVLDEQHPSETEHEPSQSPSLMHDVRNSGNESKQNSLLPDDLSETREIFPSDVLDDQHPSETEHEPSRSPGLMHDVPNTYSEFCRSVVKIREKHLPENSLLENKENNVPQELSYGDSKFQEGDCFEGSKRNVSDKVFSTAKKFQPPEFLEITSSCSTTPEMSGSENDDVVPANADPELPKRSNMRYSSDKLSRTANKFLSCDLPRLTGSCSTTPIQTDSDDSCSEKMTELEKISASSIKENTPLKPQKILVTDANPRLPQDARHKERIQRGKTSSTKRSSPEDYDELDDPFEEAKKKNRYQSPKKGDTPRKSDFAQQKRNFLSKSLFVNNNSATVPVNPFFSVKGKRQPRRSSTNDSLHRQGQDSKRANENSQLSIGESLDEFESATSKIFEDADSDSEEDFPPLLGSSRFSRKSSPPIAKAKRRSLGRVMVIETSDEESDSDQSREELVGDSLNSQQTSSDETTDEESEQKSDGDHSWDVVDDSFNSKQTSLNETMYSSGDVTVPL